jgi:hypothetical protein
MSRLLRPRKSGLDTVPPERRRGDEDPLGEETIDDPAEQQSDRGAAP